MPFQRQRLVGLRKAKGIRTQEELEAICRIARTRLNKYEKGTKTPDPDTLESLANALDATMDYFHGVGDHYDDDDEGYVKAAVKLSFEVFSRHPALSPEQRERCRPVLAHPAAPRSAEAWRALSEMIDLALKPSGPVSTDFEIIPGGKR